MNRIYQGKVTQVEIPDSANKGSWLLFHRDSDTARKLTGRIPELRQTVEAEITARAGWPVEEQKRRPKSPELLEYEKLRAEQRQQWQDALRHHHELFQADVNYYLAAFAAMVPLNCADEVWSEFRDTIIRSWNAYTGRQGTWAFPFAAACKAIGCSEKTSFGDFRCKLFLLSGSKATEEERFAALREIFESAVEAAQEMTEPNQSLEDSPKGQGRNRFNKLVMLCARKTGETRAETKHAQRDSAREATAKVSKGACLSWDDVFAFKTSPTKEDWPHKEAAAGIVQSLDDLIACLGDRITSLEDEERTTTNKEKLVKFRAKRIKLEELRDRLQKQREPFRVWCNNPKTELPTTRPSRKGSGGFDLKAAIVFALQPDLDGFRETFLLFNQARLDESAETTVNDACYAARHAGGIECRVIPFLCDVWLGRMNDSKIRQGVWPDFEKQAFVEVFTKIGQFILRERKFELRLEASEQTIRAIENRLKTESRLQDVERIAEQLADGTVDEHGRKRLYSIRERTLKSWPKVRRAWRSLLENNPGASNEDLLKEKNRLQKRLRERFGSAALFDRLVASRDVWNHDEEDPLPIWSRYVEAREEKEHLEAERLFAPAHPTNSPRFFRWAETNNKTHLPMTSDGKAFLVEVDALDFFKKQRASVRLLGLTRFDGHLGGGALKQMRP